MGKVIKIVTEYELQPYEFQCKGCKKIHKQSSYCIAQIAMGHSVTFTCDCKHKTYFEGTRMNVSTNNSSGY